jgi:5-methylcytosine-specific restriction enzyme A
LSKEYRTKEQQRKFYKSSQWNGVNGVRKQVLMRDNYECVMCKREGKVHLDSVKVKSERKSIELNVHHIKELEHHPELALELDNLQTVCLRHHNKEHNRFQGSLNKWEDDERW